jgi:hypothetical protein
VLHPVGHDPLERQLDLPRCVGDHGDDGVGGCAGGGCSSGGACGTIPGGCAGCAVKKLLASRQ